MAKIRKGEKMNFFNKTRQILTEPEKFFKSVKKGKEIVKPWKYYVIVFLIYILALIVVSIPSLFLEVSKEVSGPLIIPSAVMAFFMMIIIFGLAFGFSLGFIFVGAAIQHLFLLIVGAKKKYVETFKLVCYCSAPILFMPIFAIFEVFPVIGQAIYLIGSLALMVFMWIIQVKAAKILHDLSTLRAILGIVVIPLAFFLIIALLIAFFVIAFFSVSFAQMGLI